MPKIFKSFINLLLPFCLLADPALAAGLALPQSKFAPVPYAIQTQAVTPWLHWAHSWLASTSAARITRQTLNREAFQLGHMADALNRPYSRTVLGLAAVDWVGRAITELALPLHLAMFQDSSGEFGKVVSLIVDGLIRGNIHWTRVHHLVSLQERLAFSAFSVFVFLTLIVKPLRKSHRDQSPTQLLERILGITIKGILFAGTLVAAGGLGNGLEAGIRGFVTDWIEFGIRPNIVSPNLSDLYVIIGIFIVIILAPIQLLTGLAILLKKLLKTGRDKLDQQQFARFLKREFEAAASKPTLLSEWYDILWWISFLGFAAIGGYAYFQDIPVVLALSSFQVVCLITLQFLRIRMFERGPSKKGVGFPILDNVEIDVAYDAIHVRKLESSERKPAARKSIRGAA